MSRSLYWLQCGGCGGDSMAWLSAESPDIIDHMAMLDIEMLWHPSLSNASAAEHRELLDTLITGERTLDILCVEGAVIRGPGGTGMYDTRGGRPKKDLVAALAKQADVVIAVGTCASFGGIGAKGEIEATGLQFLRWEIGGFLGEDYRAGSGLPVINLPGCPCHCDAVTGTLTAYATGTPLELGEFNRPLEWYGLLVHQGCTRNEYHEYRVEEEDFGRRGCLFFHMGCHGPLVYGPCNKTLWNRRSSKTRAGVPCVGCTRPDFPQSYPFFRTPNLEGIPLELPDGIDRAHYLAYKSMAEAAGPQRLKDRDTRI